MGVEYSIACIDCKVTRDLGKFQNIDRDIDTKEEMILYKKEVIQSQENGDPFRSAMLVSFMAKHRRHKCILYTDTFDDDICEQVDPFFNETNGFKEDINYWNNNNDKYIEFEKMLNKYKQLYLELESLFELDTYYKKINESCCKNSDIIKSKELDECALDSIFGKENVELYKNEYESKYDKNDLSVNDFFMSKLVLIYLKQYGENTIKIKSTEEYDILKNKLNNISYDIDNFLNDYESLKQTRLFREFKEIKKELEEICV